MPDIHRLPDRQHRTPDGAGATSDAVQVPADLEAVAREFHDDCRSFLATVTEVAAGENPDVAIPLLLLAVSDLLAAGARLGAMVDVVPAEQFEPDVGEDADLDPLRIALSAVFDGVDSYTEVDDPVLGGDVVESSVAGDLVMVTASMVQGQRHYESGQVLEALWWWQYSYLATWGDRASAVLRVLQTILAHLRLDVDDEVAAEAEFDALHR